MEEQIIPKRKGRPPKKNYDEEEQFRKLLDTVDYCYETTGEIKATAVELGMNPVRVKKLLITSGKIEYEETTQIQRLLAYGKSLEEIQKIMNLKKSSINSYLPYSKLPYKEEEISANADRCDLYRKRKLAIEAISDRKSLWQCLKLFAGYKFITLDGKSFKYYCSSDESEMIIEKSNVSIPFGVIADIYEGGLDINMVNDELKNEYIEGILKRFGIISGV